MACHSPQQTIASLCGVQRPTERSAGQRNPCRSSRWGQISWAAGRATRSQRRPPALGHFTAPQIAPAWPQAPAAFEGLINAFAHDKRVCGLHRSSCSRSIEGVWPVPGDSNAMGNWPSGRETSPVWTGRDAYYSQAGSQDSWVFSQLKEAMPLEKGTGCLAGGLSLAATDAHAPDTSACIG